MTDAVLLDTHALLWWQAGGERLSRRAAARIETAQAILISPISCWEVGMLVAKERVRLDRPTAVWVRDLLAQERLAPAELTHAAGVAAAELPDFPGDPADRLLYATARSLGAQLISKDTAMRRYAAAARDVTVVW